MRVVIVDDDPDARELLSTLLRQRRAEVFVAQCAAEALALVRRELPDVLVSDIAMPEEDGYMLVGKLRALSEEEGGRTPALAVTAYAARSDRERALEAGFDGHIAKPIDVDRLVAALVDARLTRTSNV